MNMTTEQLTNEANRVYAACMLIYPPTNLKVLGRAINTLCCSNSPTDHEKALVIMDWTRQMLEQSTGKMMEDVLTDAYKNAEDGRPIHA